MLGKDDPWRGHDLQADESEHRAAKEAEGRDADLGFGPIVASEIEAPSRFVNLAYSGWYKVDERWSKATMQPSPAPTSSSASRVDAGRTRAVRPSLLSVRPITCHRPPLASADARREGFVPLCLCDSVSLCLSVPV